MMQRREPIQKLATVQLISYGGHGAVMRYRHMQCK